MCARFAIFRAMTAPVLVSYVITGANKNKWNSLNVENHGHKH